MYDGMTTSILEKRRTRDEDVVVVDLGGKEVGVYGSRDRIWNLVRSG